MNRMTFETFALRNYRKGQVFFSSKSSKDLQSISAHEKVKISTEKMTAIDTMSNKKIEFLTKVTIL